MGVLLITGYKVRHWNTSTLNCSYPFCTRKIVKGLPNFRSHHWSVKHSYSYNIMLFFFSAMEIKTEQDK